MTEQVPTTDAPAFPQQPSQPVPVASAAPVPGPIVIGGELEAALQERAVEAAAGPARVWNLRGVSYALRATMPAGAIFEVMRAMRDTEDAAAMDGVLTAIEGFFMPGQGGAFMAAAGDITVEYPVDMKYIEDMVGQLFEAYSARPLDSATS